MAPLSFDALSRALKRGEPDATYYIHGDEPVLKDEAVNALIERAVPAESRDFNLDVRAAAELDVAALHALLNTPPMLAARRGVVLRGVEQLRKKSKPRDALLAYLGRPSPETLLVLVQTDAESPEADLAARSTVVAVERLPPERAVRWVLHTAGKAKLDIEPAAAELLVQAIGADLAALRQEMDKLAVTVTGRPVAPADVSALVGIRQGETVHDLVAAAVGREPARAARLIDVVLSQAGMSGVRVVSTLGSALVGTALARAELDRGASPGRLSDVLLRHLTAARPFGLRGYRVEAAQWAEWGQRWSAGELRQALRLALAADQALKRSGISDDAGVLRELVLSLGIPARVAA